MNSSKIFIPLFLLIFILSCLNQSTKREFSKLRIRLVNNENFFLDSIRLSAPYKHNSSHHRQYDSTLNSVYYVFDSVKNGSVTITLVSLLNRIFEKNITLNSDTTITIASNEPHNFENAESIELMSMKPKNGDTIVIGFNSRGCFHFFNENIIISKGNGNYSVKFNTTRGDNITYKPTTISREFDSTFSKQIDKFFKNCEQVVKQKGICFSTTSSSVYIRKENSVLQLNDKTCNNWKGYDNIIKAIISP